MHLFGRALSCAAQWLVGALGVSAVWRLVMDRDLKQLAFAGVAAYAFAKGVSGEGMKRAVHDQDDASTGCLAYTTDCLA